MRYANHFFVFAPYSRIIICTLISSGSFHYCTMAKYGMCVKIKKNNNDFGGYMVVESDFGLGEQSFSVKSSQHDPIGRSDELHINRDTISARQPIKLGMMIIQTQRFRLKILFCRMKQVSAA